MLCPWRVALVVPPIRAHFLQRASGPGEIGVDERKQVIDGHLGQRPSSRRFRKHGDLCSPLERGPLTLLEESYRLIMWETIQEDDRGRHAAEGRFRRAEHGAQELLEAGAPAIGHRVDEPFTARSARAGLRLDLEIPVPSQPIEQIVDVSLLEIGVQLSVGTEDDVEIVPGFRASQEKTEKVERLVHAQL
jgi:hypothetical protein